MSVYIGASGPNIHIGGDTAIARAAVLDGATSHITIDGLAADAYGQTDVAHGYVMLIKAALVSQALIAAPCTKRMKTIRAANTSPRSNHLPMGDHLSE